MKHMKKLLIVAFALAMCMAMSVVAFAANADVNSGKGGTGEITITNAQPDQTYEAYRIFEAVVNPTDNTKVSYKMLSGKTLPTNDFFEIKNGYVLIKDAAKDATDATKLSTAAVEWLKSNYATIGEKAAEATPSEAGSQKITGLLFGYYYVTTTTGTAVSVDTTNNAAEITDKNPGTSIDKTITGVADGSVTADKEKAIAQVGTTVDYEVRIPIAQNAKSYEFQDVMTVGLTYVAGSMKVYVVTKDAAVAANATGNLDAGTDAATKYGTLTESADATGTNPDVKIVFNDAMLAANNGKDIVLHYQATVNKDAVIAGENPNTATIYWGHKTDQLKDTDDAKVYPAKVTVKKVDGDGNALEGAGFKIKNSANKWYKVTNGIVSWVDAEAEGTEVKPEKGTGTEAVGEFLGLADGSYTLVETTVPEGYNKADDTPFEIKAATTNDFQADLAVTSTVKNNAGTELPTTGGMGTTLFYVLGGLLVVGCAILLVARRRTNNNK